MGAFLVLLLFGVGALSSPDMFAPPPVSNHRRAIAESASLRPAYGTSGPCTPARKSARLKQFAIPHFSQPVLDTWTNEYVQSAELQRRMRAREAEMVVAHWAPWAAYFIGYFGAR